MYDPNDLIGKLFAIVMLVLLFGTGIYVYKDYQKKSRRKTSQK